VGVSVDVTLPVHVTVAGFKGNLFKFSCIYWLFFLIAQTCVFPFTYNSVNYTSCTTIGLGYSWCSPTSIYNGQSLRCASLSKLTFIIIDNAHINTKFC
jgi:hypothetical protein